MLRNIWTKLRNYLRRRRRQRAAKRLAGSPLREFVYLDEVSVYSLIASRLGAIAKEFTDTETTSLRTELGSTLGAQAPGLAKAEVSSRLEASQAQQSQVVRKSIIQSTFKELYDYESQNLVLIPSMPTPAEAPPKVRNKAELLSLQPPWVVGSDRLMRGSLAELEVELEAEPLFRLTTVTSAIVEIARESPDLFTASDHEALARIQQIQAVLEKLLVGLVPVRGRALDYKIVEVDGRHFLVHSRLVTEIPDSLGLTVFPLYVVGVTEQRLYWKDIRLVLFGESRFRLLCRLNQSGVQVDWTPVKLADVLRGLLPDLPEQIDVFSTKASKIFSGGLAAEALYEKPRQLAMMSALLRYALDLVESHGGDVEQLNMSDLTSVASEASVSGPGLDSVRQSFNSITAYVDRQLGLATTADTAADLRASALSRNGLGYDGEITVRPLVPEAFVADRNDERFLDTEMVAIYW